MTKARVLALLVGIVLLLTLPAVASAQNSPPHIFIGTATVNGIFAQAGTTVTASIGGIDLVTEPVASSGKYMLKVPQGSGTDIEFTIGALTASESGSWSLGAATELNLTASSFNLPPASDPVDPVAGPSGLRGATGSAGSAGARGAQGPAGPKGDGGSDGSAGSDGSSGSAGSAGSAGPAGPVGPAGPAGRSGSDGGGGGLSIIALILSGVALIASGGVYALSRRPA